MFLFFFVSLRCSSVRLSVCRTTIPTLGRNKQLAQFQATFFKQTFFPLILTFAFFSFSGCSCHFEHFSDSGQNIFHPKYFSPQFFHFCIFGYPCHFDHFSHFSQKKTPPPRKPDCTSPCWFCTQLGAARRDTMPPSILVLPWILGWCFLPADMERNVRTSWQVQGLENCSQGQMLLLLSTEQTLA